MHTDSIEFAQRVEVLRHMRRALNQQNGALHNVGVLHVQQQTAHHRVQTAHRRQFLNSQSVSQVDTTHNTTQHHTTKSVKQQIKKKK
jgi:hypothetical protein